MRTAILFILLWIQIFAAEPEIFNVRDFGATGDGITLDTEAINNAIEAATVKASAQVRFPPGKYLAGTIELRSDMVLFIEPGATILGTTNLAQYKFFRPPAGSPEAGFKPEWHRALILGDAVQNVTITGGGTIDGNKVFDPQGEEHMRGPHTILIGHGRQITLEKISIRDSANYAVMLEDCSDCTIAEMRITGGWDGVHFRGWPNSYCRNITIRDCQLFTGDDAIAGRYWENVVVSDCVLNSSCNGLRLIGPARKLLVNDCQFIGPGQFPHRTSKRNNMLAAIALQPGAWDPTEGQVDEVHLSDLVIQNVTTPFHFALRGNNTAGHIEVAKVAATGIYRGPLTIESWTTNSFTNVVFRDINVEFKGGGELTDAKIPIKAPGVDARALPVWGVYARNVQQLTFQNVRFKLAKDDPRPAARFDQVELLTLDEFQLPATSVIREPVILNAVAKIVRRP